uniref:E3 ubiquitin-protein ligase TRIM32 n=1 Tax=Amphilophus citrinellus TaxID=61819 RepID=A0A3Q0SQY6_AMPCI
MRSHSERRALPGFSALLTHSTPKLKDVTSPPLLSRTPRESIFTSISLTSPPPWVTRALSNLEQGEQELLNLRERQQAEVETVNRELDGAAIEAQREERRLLEKVEQDHREAQRHLSQVKRENAAAVRVVQSLIDQQLRKIGQLKEQIQRWGITAGESNKNQLQRGVAEVTQPWELSLTLKRVSFVPSPQSESLSLGEIDVPKTRVTQGLRLNRVSRSLSMSTIEGDKLYKVNETQQDMKEGAVSGLRELEEEGGPAALDSAYLVKQFGKQGSGRTDFNLPSGVHATAKGQLFVVDCGNARIQVTDLQKNVVQQVSPSGSERSSRICNYFDVAVNSKGLIALTCAAERAVLVFSRHGRLLQTFGGTMISSTNEELDAPRGVTVNHQDEFLVADIKRGTITALKLDPKTGARLERTVVTGYHRPYLVAACLTTGLMAVSERGNETGRVPCIRVLEPGWNTIRILGVCSGLGPVLTCPWGLCIDSDGDVLVTDWGKQHHRVLIYPSKGVGWPLVTDNLSSPRGLALLPDGHVVVSDSMNHCIKIYQYK